MKVLLFLWVLPFEYPQCYQKSYKILYHNILTNTLAFFSPSSFARLIGNLAPLGWGIEIIGGIEVKPSNGIGLHKSL